MPTVTAAQWSDAESVHTHILREVCAHDAQGERLTITDLAEELGVESGVVEDRVDELRSLQLVRRRWGGRLEADTCLLALS